MEIVNKPKKYRSEKNLLYSCQYHVIFCPKYRRPVLTNKIAKRLRELILEKQGEYEYKIYELEILPDHVHLLIDTNPKIGVYTTVNKIKGYTSRLLRAEFSALKSKLPSLWTRSKFISSVGAVSLEVVKQYIQEQKNV
ncbi:MAG: IS200/IS605 family transposase [Candidatus Hodarchaeales archaeon]